METRLVHAASEFRREPRLQALFHTIVTSQVSYYAPPDTGVSDLQLVAVEYLLSIEGAGRICRSAPFCGGRFLGREPPSPFVGEGGILVMPGWRP